MTNTFTLEDIYNSHPAHRVCTRLMLALPQELGKPPPLSTKLTLGDILIISGRADTLWCMQFLTARARVSTVLPFLKRAVAFGHHDKTEIYLIAVLEKWLADEDIVDLKASLEAERRPTIFGKFDAIFGEFGPSWPSAICVHVEHRIMLAGGNSSIEREQQVNEIIEMHPPIQIGGRINRENENG